MATGKLYPGIKFKHHLEHPFFNSVVIKIAKIPFPA